MSRYEPVDLSKMKTCNLAQRGGLVHLEDFAGLPEKGCSFAAWSDWQRRLWLPEKLTGLSSGRWAAMS